MRAFPRTAAQDDNEAGDPMLSTWSPVGTARKPKGCANMPKHVETKPRGKSYFSRKKIHALVADPGAKHPQLFLTHPVSDDTVSSD